MDAGPCNPLSLTFSLGIDYVNELDLCKDFVVPARFRPTTPQFFSPPNWLEDIMDIVTMNICFQEGEATNRKSPICFARFSRGGKTRALMEVAKVASNHCRVIVISFNGETSFDEIDTAICNTYEEEGPLLCFLRRVAFTLLKEPEQPSKFRSFKKFVNRESLQTWLGEEKILLLIDELNQLPSIKMPLANVLLDIFLKPHGRFFIFTSHFACRSQDLLNDFLTGGVQKSSRVVFFPRLPIVENFESLQVAWECDLRREKKSLEKENVVWYGQSPGLLWDNGAVDSKVPEINIIITDMLKEDKVTRSTLMKDIACSFFESTSYVDVFKKLQWILDFYTVETSAQHFSWPMCYLSATLSALCSVDLLNFSATQFLIRICAAFIPHHKVNDGSRFEYLFVIVLLLRLLAELPDSKLLPLSCKHIFVEDCGASVDLAGLLQSLQKPQQFPSCSLFFPKESRFELVDCVLVYWIDDEKVEVHSYQLKAGNKRPRNLDSRLLRNLHSLMLPHAQTSVKFFWYHVCGRSAIRELSRKSKWIVPNKDDKLSFFGDSGRLWVLLYEKELLGESKRRGRKARPRSSRQSNRLWKITEMSR